MVEKSIKYNDPIIDLHRFNIPYDNKLYHCCHKYNLFPENYVENFNIDDKIITLRNMFKAQKKWEDIVKYIKENNLKVDRYCFENANDSCKKILTNLRAKPSVGSIFNYLPKIGYGRTYMNQLFGDKFETSEEMEETYNIEILC